MAYNDKLKPYLATPSYSGRYLVFAFNEYYPAGGQQDIIGSFDTLDEIEASFRLDLADDRPLKELNKSGRMTNAYQYLEVFDTDEKEFIDINHLHFTAYD